MHDVGSMIIHQQKTHDNIVEKQFRTAFAMFLGYVTDTLGGNTIAPKINIKHIHTLWMYR